MSYDPIRRRPYKTGELSAIFGVSAKTIVRWIDAGRFGPEDTAWRWTEGGKGKGDRIVYAKAVNALIERIATQRPPDGV